MRVFFSVTGKSTWTSLCDSKRKQATPHKVVSQSGSVELVRDVEEETLEVKEERKEVSHNDQDWGKTLRKVFRAFWKAFHKLKIPQSQPTRRVAACSPNDKKKKKKAHKKETGTSNWSCEPMHASLEKKKKVIRFTDPELESPPVKKKRGRPKVKTRKKQPKAEKENFSQGRPHAKRHTTCYGCDMTFDKASVSKILLLCVDFHVTWVCLA